MIEMTRLTCDGAEASFKMGDFAAGEAAVVAAAARLLWVRRRMMRAAVSTMRAAISRAAEGREVRGRWEGEKVAVQGSAIEKNKSIKRLTAAGTYTPRDVLQLRAQRLQLPTRARNANRLQQVIQLSTRYFRCRVTVLLNLCFTQLKHLKQGSEVCFSCRRVQQTQVRFSRHFDTGR
jgi:hypothetical protein